MGSGRPLTLVCAVVGAAVVAVTAPAFTATSSVAAARAGDGAGSISGYTVSQISTTLSATDPTLVAAVQFRLAPANARTARVRIVGSGSWYACTIAGGEDATCDVSPGVAVASVDQLRVVASS